MKILKNTVLVLVIGALMIQPPAQARETPLEKGFIAVGECIIWGVDGVRMAVVDGFRFVNRRLNNKPLMALVGVGAVTMVFFPSRGADLVAKCAKRCVVHTYSCLKCDRAFLLLVAGYLYKSVNYR